MFADMNDESLHSVETVILTSVKIWKAENDLFRFDAVWISAFFDQTWINNYLNLPRHGELEENRITF